MLLKQTVVKLAKALNCTVKALMDVFCEMNHIKKEMLIKTLNEKMNNHRKEHSPKEPAIKITDFMEVLILD